VAQKLSDLIIAVCVVLVLLWFVLEARFWPFHSRLFPWSIGFTALGLAIIQVFISLRQVVLAHRNEAHNRPESNATRVDRSVLWRLLTIGAWIPLFLAGIWLFGFRLGSLLLTVSFLKLGAREGYSKCLGVGLMNYLFFLIVFDLMLGVPLFDGALAQWLRTESLDKALVRYLVVVVAR
jgi:hypothetical protein